MLFGGVCCTRYPLLFQIFASACSLTDDGVSGIILQSPRLHTIQLYWLPRISDTVLYCIAATCSSVVCLNLSGCVSISDGGIKAIAASCPHITDIDLTK